MSDPNSFKDDKTTHLPDTYEQGRKVDPDTRVNNKEPLHIIDEEWHSLAPSEEAKANLQKLAREERSRPRQTSPTKATNK